MSLVEFSVREEITKRTTMKKIKQWNKVYDSYFTGVNSNDIKEIRVIDNRYRILATSDINNQSIVGQRSMDDISKKIYNH